MVSVFASASIGLMEKSLSKQMVFHAKPVALQNQVFTKFSHKSKIFPC